MAEVLVIEDEKSLLHTLRYNLDRAGHEVRLCTDGSLGQEVVRENPPDLLLLDLMLPGLNGLESAVAFDARWATRPCRCCPSWS
jgi:DNA-binding response OmpR family regulator